MGEDIALDVRDIALKIRTIPADRRPEREQLEEISKRGLRPSCSGPLLLPICPVAPA
jgi:hypothetical protein